LTLVIVAVMFVVLVPAEMLAVVVAFTVLGLLRFLLLFEFMLTT
jgi:hypothetical protein